MLSESFKIRLSELAGVKKTGELNDNFYNWFNGSKVVDKSCNPMVVYHGTGKKFKKFNIKKGNQPIIWFTSDRNSVEAGEVGAQGKGHIMDLYVTIKNPAGWKEYGNLGLGQLRDRGFDGVILPDDDGTFTGFIFNANQIKSVFNDGSWDADDANIYS